MIDAFHKLKMGGFQFLFNKQSLNFLFMTTKKQVVYSLNFMDKNKLVSDNFRYFTI